MNKNNITLIGMSGVGKTTVGKELVKVLDGYGFVDIDDEIEKYSGKTIPEIFEEFGEPFFRVLEKDTIKKFIKIETKQVISLGGGAFEDELTRKNLLEKSTVIYLKASSKEIYERLVCHSEAFKGDSSDSVLRMTIAEESHKNENLNRPLLKDVSPEKIEGIMKNRIPNYEKSHYTIDTTGKTPYNIVKEIVSQCLN